jgi:formate hydrogenlyase subunit 6/NADH:ubiquinone oxidoreductase subunit I
MSDKKSDELSLSDILGTALSGMKATAHAAMKQAVTEEYPDVHPSLPWGTKAQLYVNTLDCISCYKCAKACPSDCIRIDSVRAPAGTLSDTTDGHKRTYQVIRFDIDMGQCCYCGLCTGRSSYVPPGSKDDPAALAYADKTAACPTDCINFYPRFENADGQPSSMLYHFADLTFDDACCCWNMTGPDKRRTTHPGKPEADYESHSQENPHACNPELQAL